MSKLILDHRGNWVEGKAGPKNLRQDLRKLPGEYVTNEIAVDTKIHELDPPHVARTILRDKAKEAEAALNPKKDTAKDAIKKLKCAQPGEYIPLNQWEIDCARIRVINALIQRMYDDARKGAKVELTPCHLWFPDDNANKYQLRTGNPPADVDRPKHLQRFRLEIDVVNWPQTIIDELKARGVEVPDATMILAGVEACRIKPNENSSDGSEITESELQH